MTTWKRKIKKSAFFSKDITGEESGVLTNDQQKVLATLTNNPVRPVTRRASRRGVKKLKCGGCDSEINQKASICSFVLNL